MSKLTDIERILASRRINYRSKRIAFKAGDTERISRQVSPNCPVVINFERKRINLRSKFPIELPPLTSSTNSAGELPTVHKRIQSCVPISSTHANGLSEILRIESEKPAKIDHLASPEELRISKLTKLAVPYKVLAESLNKAIASRRKSSSPEALKIPTLPKSPFGKHESYNAAKINFEEVPLSIAAFEIGKDQIQMIKKNSGRTCSISTATLKIPATTHRDTIKHDVQTTPRMQPSHDYLKPSRAGGHRRGRSYGSGIEGLKLDYIF